MPTVPASVLEQTFNAQLAKLKARAQGRTAPRCAISYAWPAPDEQGLHERVLRLAEDMIKAGIDVLLTF